MLVAAFERDGKPATISFAPQTRGVDEPEAAWVTRMAALSLPPGTEFEVVEVGAISPTKEELYAYASRRRSIAEAVGIEVNVAGVGAPPLMVFAATTLAGQMAVAGAVQLATIEPARIFNWATTSGPLELTAAQIIKIGMAVGAHVQATYTALAEVYAGIAADAIVSLGDINDWEWPGGGA